MAIQTDVNEIETNNRTFIDTMNDWNIGESRKFVFRGYEKVRKYNKDKTKINTFYYIYGWKIVDDKVGGEETLSVFASSGQGLKTSGVKPYQELTVTREKNDNGFDDWKFEAGKKIYKPTECDTPIDYPATGEPEEAEKKTELRTNTSSTAKKVGELPSAEEINIDDIPF